MTRTTRSLCGRAGAASWLVGMVLIAGAASARAQTADQSPAVSIGVGGGVSKSFHSDLNFTAPTFEVDATFRRSPHVAVEARFGQSRHNEGETLLNVPITGPAGPMGFADRIEQATNSATTFVEANLLGKIGLGHVRLFAGGGAGVLTMRRVFRQTTCLAGVSACDTFENEFSNLSLMAQAVARVEVPVSARVSAYVAGRYWLPFQDVGASGVGVTAGARVSF